MIFVWICGVIVAAVVLGIVIGTFVDIAWRAGLVLLAALALFVLAEPERAARGVEWALNRPPVQRAVHLGDFGRRVR